MADLVCLSCRRATEQRIDLSTLDRAGDVFVCKCGRRYPIIDGVPLVLADPAGYLRNEIAAVVERDLAREVAALLAEPGPDDAPYAQLLEHLSIYLDAHWGDRAEPPPDGPSPAFGLEAIAARIADRAREPVGDAVELGCSVGRILAELARGAERVVGVELRFSSLRRARKLLAGEPLAYARRTVGRCYIPASVSAPATDRVTLVCGDALDPPLVPGMFDRVVAINLLDSVRNPGQLLAVVDALCAPGGEVILTSPYAWQSSAVDDAERIGGADPAGAIAARFRDGTDLRARYRIEDEAELPWTLRRDSRGAVAYRCHSLRMRKGEGT